MGPRNLKEGLPIAAADALLQDDTSAYLPRDAIADAVSSATVTGSAGVLVAAVQNSMTRQNIGALGIFTRFGGTLALFTAMGGTFAFIRTASANLREKDDAYNTGLGGFFAGALMGLPKRSAASVLGNGALLGIALAGTAYAGVSFFSVDRDPNEDRFAEKEEARRRFRRPINEVINEIGEGRGIYGPGYEERRKQRIKNAYGIDVAEPYYKS